MATRVITALIGVPLLLVLLFAGGWALFAGAVALFCLLGLWEFYRACAERGVPTVAAAGFAATALLLLAATPWGAARVGPYQEALYAALFLAAILREIARSKRTPLTSLGATLLGVLYVGWLFSHLILLRVEGTALLARVGGRAPVASLGGLALDAGGWLLLFIFLITWASDTGAYFAGRAWGKRRLAPSLSPGKTVEGAAGGFLATIVVAGLMGHALGMGAATSLVLGAAAGVLGPLGDLWESALKRELSLKDFGTLLPGHGGVLDRFDSLLFTAPAIYYLLKHGLFL
jgi:phosphatidate cytidylyltransferase